MVLSMLQARPMCTISSNTTLRTSEKALGVGALAGVWSFIDHNPHRYGGSVESSSSTATCKACRSHSRCSITLSDAQEMRDSGISHGRDLSNQTCSSISKCAIEQAVPGHEPNIILCK